jgi:hypothetical protein
MNHQFPENCSVMHTLLTNLCAGAHSDCMPCSPARANITYMPATTCCPNCHLSPKHAWGSQESGSGPARAPVSRFVHMPTFALFHIHTSQPSGPAFSAPCPPRHISSDLSNADNYNPFPGHCGSPGAKQLCTTVACVLLNVCMHPLQLI